MFLVEVVCIWASELQAERAFSAELLTNILILLLFIPRAELRDNVISAPVRTGGIMTALIPCGIGTLTIDSLASSLLPTDKANEKGRLTPLLLFPAVPEKSSLPAARPRGDY